MLIQHWKDLKSWHFSDLSRSFASNKIYTPPTHPGPPLTHPGLHLKHRGYVTVPNTNIHDKQLYKIRSKNCKGWGPYSSDARISRSWHFIEVASCYIDSGSFFIEDVCETSPRSERNLWGLYLENGLTVLMGIVRCAFWRLDYSQKRRYHQNMDHPSTLLFKRKYMFNVQLFAACGKLFNFDFWK